MSFEEKLIEEVKQRRIIFDLTSGGYKNIIAKEKAWIDVAGKLGVTDEHAKKKWRNLRDVYKRVKQRMRCPSGSGARRPIRWKFYENMRFLDDVPFTRDTIGNANEFLNISLEPQQYCDSSPLEPSSEASESQGTLSPQHASASSPQLRRKPRGDVLREQFSLLIEDVSKKIDTYDDDSTSKLFDALATRMRNAKLTDEETAIVELKVTECVINTIITLKRNRD